jgi:hypothetical protein
MRKTFWCVAAATLFTAGAMAPAAEAQSDESIAAAIAIYMTPVGSFANVAPSALGEARTSAGLDFGRYSGDDNRSSYGVHLDWSMFRATVGVATATGLENVWMAGLSSGRNLLVAGPVHVGGEANLGLGRVKDDVSDETLNALSAGVRVPFSLAHSGEGLSVTPYLAPGAFWGRLSATGESLSGFRATLNGGVRFAFSNGVALDVGAQRIFIDEAETLFGLGLSLSR